MKFKALPINDLTDATLDFEQLQTRDILDRTASNTARTPGAPVAQTRVLGTAYQPSTTRPTFVLATINTGNVASGGLGEVNVNMDASNPPTTNIGNAAIAPTGATVGANIPISFWVPAAFFYKLVSASGAPSIVSVYEMVF